MDTTPLPYESSNRWLRAHSKVLRWSLLMFLLSIALLVSLRLGAFDSHRMNIIGYSYLGCGALILLLTAIFGASHRLSAWLRAPWLRRVGTISYGLYLYHLLVLGLCHGVLLGRPRPEIRTMEDVGVTLLALVLTLGLATLSWEFCEKHFVAKAQSVSYERISKMKARIISCGMTLVVALALQGGDVKSEEPNAKPQWLAKPEAFILQGLNQHASEGKARSTNLSHLEMACPKAFTEWFMPPAAEAVGWKCFDNSWMTSICLGGSSGSSRGGCGEIALKRTTGTGMLNLNWAAAELRDATQGLRENHATPEYWTHDESSDVPMFRCSDVPLFRCSVVPMFRCSNVTMF